MAETVTHPLSDYFVARNGHGGISLWQHTENAHRPREVAIMLREEADVMARALDLIAAVEKVARDASWCGECSTPGDLCQALGMEEPT